MNDGDGLEDLAELHFQKNESLRLQTLVHLYARFKVVNVLSDRVNLNLSFLPESLHFFVEEIDELGLDSLQVIKVVDLGCELDCTRVLPVNWIDCEAQSISQVLVVAHEILPHLVHLLVSLLISLHQICFLLFERFYLSVKLVRRPRIVYSSTICELERVEIHLHADNSVHICLYACLSSKLHRQFKLTMAVEEWRGDLRVLVCMHRVLIK